MGPWIAIASAFLFGASIPLAKLLLGDGVSPWLMAGVLYLGSGVGLSLVYLIRRRFRAATREAPLMRADIPVLALTVFVGGVLAPLLLMWGLAQTPASAASLLLNLEGLATMAIAWLWYRENVDRRLLAGAFAILAGGVVLSWQGGPSGVSIGALAIVGACIAWGFDNNLTRKFSGSDPVQIAMIKGLVAGGMNTGLAIGLGAALPPGSALLGGVAVGFVGYGISLALFVVALRHLGAARTGAYFSTSPFVGAGVAVLFLGESVSLPLLLAGLLMAAGVYLHLSERHSHEHAHERLEHEHRHVHDPHHQHEHRPEDPSGEPHTHSHRHAPLVHSHPHYPDLHHRHGH